MECDISEIEVIEDDDYIFSEADLDSIIALEKKAMDEEEVKENRVFSSTANSCRNGKSPPKKIPRLQHSSSSSIAPGGKGKPEIVDLEDDINDGDGDTTEEFLESSFTIPSHVSKRSGIKEQSQLSEKPNTDEKERFIPFRKKDPPKPVAMSMSTSTMEPSKKFRFQKSKPKTSDPPPVPPTREPTPPPVVTIEDDLNEGFVDFDDEDDLMLLGVDVNNIVAAAAAQEKQNAVAPTPVVPVPPVAKNETLPSISKTTSSKTSTSSITIPKVGSGSGTSKKFNFQKNKSSSQKSAKSQGEVPITNFFTKEEPKPQPTNTNTDSDVTTFDSSSTSFELEDDNDDHIFAAIDLENLSAIDTNTSHVNDKKPGSSSMTISNEKKKNPFLKPATPPSTKTTTTTGGKKFTFQKQRSLLSQTNANSPTSATSSSISSKIQSLKPIASKSRPEVEMIQTNANTDFDNFGDEDFLLDDELEEQIKELERTAQEESSAKPITTARQQIIKTLPYIFPPCVGSVAADEEWKNYVKKFATEECFRTPWFQSIPITGLNINTCRTIVSRLDSPHELVQFGLNYLLPFLRELKATTTLTRGDSEAPLLNKEYFTELVLALEKVLVRYKEEYLNEEELCDSSTSYSNFQELVEVVFDIYFKSELDFSMTSIPNILLHLYPSALGKIISSTVKTGNVTLVLPLCSTRQTLQKVLTMLHSTIDEDPDEDEDFECNLRRTGLTSIIRKLLESLKLKLGVAQFVNILPSGFQSLYSIELALKSSNSSANLIRKQVIARQILPFLEEVFKGGNEEFAKFLIGILLPLTQTLLHDKQLTWTTVKYRLYPNLWHYLRQNLWRTD